jgi:hypothetical protein
MLIVLGSPFRGERPAVDARLLNRTEAQIAENVKLWRGVLEPWKSPQSVQASVLGSALQSIYRYHPPTGAATWMQWDIDVDVARSSVAGSSELYWTGDGEPKIGDQSSIESGSPYYDHDLGVPAPVAAPSIAAIAQSELVGGDVVDIQPVLEAGGVIGNQGVPASVTNRQPYSVEGAIDTNGLMRFLVRVNMDFAQRKAYTTNVTVQVEMDPATASKNSGTVIFNEVVILGLPKNTSGRNVWTTADYPESQYTFTYSPPPGEHTFRLWTEHGFKSTSDGGTPDNREQYLVIDAADGKLLVTLDTASHGLEAGDRIQFSGVAGTGTLDLMNSTPFTIDSVSGADIVIDAPGISGVYDNDPAATWIPIFDDVERVPRNYVYTNVATLGSHDMESAPSPASQLINVSDGEAVDLSGFSEPPSDGRPYSKIYIYRLGVGVTQDGFFFVGEINVATWDFDTDVFTDAVRGVELGRALPSQYTSNTGLLVRWDVPAAGMQGLIELPNGLYAAFLGKELMLSEPYQPHAWPVAYRRSMVDDIVALGAFGSTIVVSTKGRPVLVTGVDPGSMTEEQIETAYPNLSKRGMVDLGYGVTYPSQRGQALISYGDARIVTDDLFDDDTWKNLNPSSFNAVKYGNRYMWFFTDVDDVDRGYIFDPNDPLATLTRLTSYSNAIWSDPQTDELFLVLDEGGEAIFEWDADDTDILGAMKVVSKEFVNNVPASIGVVKVDADIYPVSVDIYMDGDLYDSIAVLDDSEHRVNVENGLGRRWHFEIGIASIEDSIGAVNMLYAATTADELTRYLSG